MIEIDSRPSDALALAVRAGVPILVDRQVMEAAGLIPEEDLQGTAKPAGEATEDSLGESVEEGAEGPTTEEGEGRLTIFEDFLDKLDKDKPDSDEEKD